MFTKKQRYCAWAEYYLQQTALQRNAHEQTIICKQLFAVPSANQNDGKNNMNDIINIIWNANIVIICREDQGLLNEAVLKRDQLKENQQK